MREVTLSEIERRLQMCEQTVKDLSDKITATDHNLVATTTTLNSVPATLGKLKGAVESLKARPATMGQADLCRDRRGRCGNHHISIVYYSDGNHMRSYTATHSDRSRRRFSAKAAATRKS